MTTYNLDHQTIAAELVNVILIRYFTLGTTVWVWDFCVYLLCVLIPSIEVWFHFNALWWTEWIQWCISSCHPSKRVNTGHVIDIQLIVDNQCLTKSIFMNNSHCTVWFLYFRDVWSIITFGLCSHGVALLSYYCVTTTTANPQKRKITTGNGFFVCFGFFFLMQHVTFS